MKSDTKDTVGTPERWKLERAARIHWFHWIVVGLSLCLTLVAWHVSKRLHQDKVRRQFDREASQVIDLVRERMQKYEDAIWSGVALLHTQSGDIDRDEWRAFAQSIRIDVKYPGINGLGVIRAIERRELGNYLARERVLRPDFRVHPPHDQDMLYPITFIEPVQSNRQAVGLDMAHEANRLSAALKARDTGDAQITGPIVLVQDEDRTPGFLFYAPFYAGPAHPQPEDRVSTFGGMVYAPFVAGRLMRGVLAKDNRHVSIRLSDEERLLYDELVETEQDFDPDPLFQMSAAIPMYGRTWTFDVWSARSFRAAQRSSQPLMILIGAIIIDSLLICLFLFLSRASRQALRFADLATRELQDRNGELEQFVYSASHDLKSPVVTLQGFLSHLRHDVESSRTDRISHFLDRLDDAADRMTTHIEELLDLSRIGRVIQDPEMIDVGQLLREVISNHRIELDERQVRVHVDEHIPAVMADRGRLVQVFDNLLVNAIKYGCTNSDPIIECKAEAHHGEIRYAVRDNGPGVPSAYHEKIFGLFQRLDPDGRGSGIGLAIVKRIVEVHGGRAWVESSDGSGAAFWIAIPRAA